MPTKCIFMNYTRKESIISFNNIIEKDSSEAKPEQQKFSLSLFLNSLK